MKRNQVIIDSSEKNYSMSDMMKRRKGVKNRNLNDWAKEFENPQIIELLDNIYTSRLDIYLKRFAFIQKAHAQNIYFYKDEHGVLHTTDDPIRDAKRKYFCPNLSLKLRPPSVAETTKLPNSILDRDTPTSSKFRPFLSLRSRMGSSADREVITKHVQYFSEKYDLDHHLVMAMIEVESGFNHKAVSRAGAQGLLQIMSATQQDLGLTAPFDPKENIEIGIQYLKQLLDRFPDLSLALAAYNAGPANVERYKGIPPFRETQDYVRKVTANYDRRRATRE